MLKLFSTIMDHSADYCHVACLTPSCWKKKILSKQTTIQKHLNNKMWHRVLITVPVSNTTDVLSELTSFY